MRRRPNMRRIRSRLALLLLIIVMASSIVTIIITELIRNEIIMVRNPMQSIIFGYALKDLLLLAATGAITIVSIVMLSKKTANPIVELTNAAREIAAGNFNVEINLKDKAEEYGDLASSFNLMVRELRGNEYLRKDFISNVSHELRTPLTIIEGYARLLEEGGLTEGEQRDYARLIAEESGRLVRMTSNMLRLSKLDTQTITKPALFSLDEQIRQTVLLLEPKWSEKNQQLTVDLDELTIAGDEELLSQVWFNLMDNAIKYTGDSGKIHISARKTVGGIRVEIKDNGIGMDAATLDRAFEQFFQGDHSRRNEGSGLGLAIVRRIVELHNGTVTAESGKDKGSLFRVVLPVAQASDGTKRK